MPLKIKGLQVRARDDNRCSNPKCRRDCEVSYLEGATPLNPTYGVQLCDEHAAEFVQELRKHYVNQPGGLRTVPCVDKGEMDDVESESSE